VSNAPGAGFRALLDRPIFILSTPRSGSTLLFETMEQAPGLFSLGRESHKFIEHIPALFPPNRGWDSNRLTAEDARADVREQVAAGFYGDIKDRDGTLPNGPVRMLEKTPKNALRVPFFDAIWPDSYFVYLYRDVRRTLASMMEAWASGAFRTYPRLPGWSGYPWSLVLVPGWRELIGRPLPVVVAHQWARTTNILLDDLSLLPKKRVCVLGYEDFLNSPQPVVERIARFTDLTWDKQLGAELPMSKVTVSRPDPDKWRRLEREIEAVMPIVEAAEIRARAFLADRSEEAVDR